METLEQELRDLYKKIEICNGFQAQQLWYRVGEIKQELRKIKGE